MLTSEKRKKNQENFPDHILVDQIKLQIYGWKKEKRERDNSDTFFSLIKGSSVGNVP